MVDVAITLALGKLKELRMNYAGMRMLNAKSNKLLLIGNILESIQGSVSNADLKNREKTEVCVFYWIREVQSMAVEIEDVIDEFLHKLAWDELESAWWKCLCFNEIKDAFLVKQVSEQIDNIDWKMKNICYNFLAYIIRIKDGPLSLNYSRLPSCSNFHSWEMNMLKLEDDMIGFDSYLRTLKEKLLRRSSCREVMYITGGSGIGKTSLAKKVYNSIEVQNSFEVRIWLHLPLHFRLSDLGDHIRENLLIEGHKIEEETSVCDIRRCIVKCLQGKRYIVVLDDISRMSEWDYLSSILPEEQNGSRVVIICRPRSDVQFHAWSESGSIILDFLSKAESKAVFCQRAFSSFNWPSEFTDVSFEDIHDITVGHPLVVLLLAGLLCSQVPPVAWKEVLAQLKCHKLTTAIDRIISLSFDYLPDDIKPCFLYFAGLPERTVFSVDKLVRLWDAEGFIKSSCNGEKTVEKVGQDILKELISRQLVELVSKDDKGHLKEVALHDIIHDFVQSEARHREFFEIRDNMSSPDNMRRLSLGNDIYKHPILFSKLRSLLCYFEERPWWVEEDFCNLNFLRSARFLRVIDIHSSLVKMIPEEIGTMIHLRYLGICSQNLKELPSTIKNLILLQTLDIAGTSVKNLTSGFWNIPTLKHVFGSLLVMPPRVGFLVNLLTLRSVNCSTWSPGSYSLLRKMIRLRSLELRGLLHYDANTLSSALGELKFIEHLILSGKGLPLRVFAISTISHLQTLELHGTLDNNWPGIDTVSNMRCNMQSLNTVRLFFSNATQAFVHALGKLPNLFKLEMNKAYNGQELAFSAHGFYRLKELELVELDDLCTCRIEASCMPQLEKFTLVKCGNMRMLPDGLNNLKQLKEMAILHMPRLSQSIHEGREDSYNIFSHVQVIKIRR